MEKKRGRVCVIEGEKGWEELSMRRTQLNTTQSKRSGRRREKMRWKLEGSVFAALSRLRKRKMDGCRREKMWLWMCVCACWAPAVSSVNVMGELLRAVRRRLCSLWGLYSQHVLVFTAVHTDAFTCIPSLVQVPLSHVTSVYIAFPWKSAIIEKCASVHGCFCVYLHPVCISEDLQPTVVSLLIWWLVFFLNRTVFFVCKM